MEEKNDDYKKHGKWSTYVDVGRKTGYQYVAGSG